MENRFPEALTIEQLQEYLSKKGLERSVRTLWKMKAEGVLPSFKPTPGSVRFRKVEIDAWWNAAVEGRNYFMEEDR
jgi:predicted DNA-binding transcriptional regulator AlpA